MTAPRWHRPSIVAALAPYAVGAVLAAVACLGAWVALTDYGARRYEAGRASLLAESVQWTTASNDAWRRVADSLAREHTDTVVVTRIVRAREVAAAVLHAADSKDSTLSAADSNATAPSLYDGPLRACGVQLDSLANACDAYRASATALLAAKDSVIAADSVELKARAVIAAEYKRQALDIWKAREDDAAKYRATRWLYALGGALVTWGVMR